MTTSSPPFPSPSPTPIHIHIPPSLQKYAIPLSHFISSHPKYTVFGTGAFIFHSNLLLLAQRSPTESYAHKWEIPGGGSEASDPTILHSVAREVFEETGLKLTRFVRQVGEGQEFRVSKGALCLKLNFEIEVEEIHGAEKGKEGLVEVTLDPEEHQAHAWASRDDILEDRYPLMSADQRALILEAFSMRKAESERLKEAIDGGAKKEA